MSKSKKVILDRGDLADLVECLEDFMADHEGSKEYNDAQSILNEIVNQANVSPHYILELHHEPIKRCLVDSYQNDEHNVTDENVAKAVEFALMSLDEQSIDEIGYHYRENFI